MISAALHPPSSKVTSRTALQQAADRTNSRRLREQLTECLRSLPGKTCNWRAKSLSAGSHKSSSIVLMVNRGAWSPSVPRNWRERTVFFAGPKPIGRGTETESHRQLRMECFKGRDLLVAGNLSNIWIRARD